MKNKNLTAMLLAVAISLVVFNCKDTGTGPTQKPYKDPREMTWTADTLPVPEGAIQVLPEDMLVVSPTDVWLATWMGHGQVMHFDGRTWKSSLDLGGGIDCLTQDVSGNIWAGGYSNTIYLGCYDGNSWARVNDKGITGEILDMCTDVNGNIWACGRNGVVLEYTQGKWIADTIKINFSYPVEYFLKSIEFYNGKAFVLASSINKNTLTEKYFYIYGAIKNWTIADSITLDSPSSTIKWGYRCLYSSDNNVELFSFGLGGIWQYASSSWKKLKDAYGAIDGLFVKEDNYIITVGDFQKALYFDGNTWNDIKEVLKTNDPYFTYWKVWTDGYEIIIAGFGTVDGIDKTIIWHGK
jgi:hypothetical protein